MSPKRRPQPVASQVQTPAKSPPVERAPDEMDDVRLAAENEARAILGKPLLVRSCETCGLVPCDPTSPDHASRRAWLRLGAKPEAIAARAAIGRGVGALIDPSNAPRDHRLVAMPRGTDVSALDLRTTERDRALELVGALARIIRRTGGYMPHEDQTVLREAEALLAQTRAL